MTTLSDGTAGLVLSWASGSCNVDTFVALQVLELKAGKIHSESSEPCFSRSERDAQLLSASRLHRTQPERQEGIIQEAHLSAFLVH